MWTRKSAAVAGGSLLALLAGVSLPNYGLAAAGLLGAALLALAFLQARRLRVGATRAISLERCHENDAFQVTLRLQNEGEGGGFLVAADTLPPQLRLESGSNVAFARLGAGEALEVAYEAAAPIKGHYALGPVRLRIMDAFGLFHEDVTLDVEDYLTVYPKGEDVREAPDRSRFPRTMAGVHIVHQPGQGMEFFGLRDYMYGDSLRQVNWKASARAKDMVVNQREKESMSDVTLLLDARAASAAGPQDQWPLVQGCRAAATLLDVFNGRRDRLRFVTYGDEVDATQPGTGERHRFQIMDALAGLEPSGDTPLLTAVDELLPTLTPKSPVFIISSLVGDDTIMEAVSKLLAYENSVVVVSPGIPGAHSPNGDAGSEDGDGDGAGGEAGEDAGANGADPEAALAALERQRRVDLLRGYGATVIDWTPGDTLTVALAQGVIA